MVGTSSRLIPMKRTLAPLLLCVGAWAAFGSWAEAHRAALQTDPPALGAGIEADMAARHCANLRIDTEGFRAFSHAHHLNHADFFTRKRSVGLQRSLDAAALAFREQPAEACARMWDRYGATGTEARLLARR